MEKILIVEDEQEISDIVATNLRLIGFEPEQVSRGEDALSKMKEGAYRLVVLDVVLPGIGGIEVCRRMREIDRKVPILMLTAMSEEVEKVLGLEAGADDYLTKPFGVQELMARVRALIRRTGVNESAPASAPTKIVRRDLEMDLEKRRVTIAGNPVELTVVEFDLLAFLASNPGRPFTREDLAEEIWGFSVSGQTGTMTSQLSRLRKKIDPDTDNPRFIKTVWGFGYQFIDDDEIGA